MAAQAGERRHESHYASWTLFAFLQVLVDAMALGATFRDIGRDVILDGASTFVASYLARTCGSDERRASLLRVNALNHFLREIETFQLHKVSREWVKKTDGFRQGLENMLGNQPGSIPEAASINSSVEEEVVLLISYQLEVSMGLVQLTPNWDP
ncbi:hypothetical protein EDB86DRAFT_3087795 [Lactarius hatsudake]|nr:hypothetical protein EDB86DRAFT_3087795 [Lactarius hatsudake]